MPLVFIIQKIRSPYTQILGVLSSTARRAIVGQHIGWSVEETYIIKSAEVARSSDVNRSAIARLLVDCML